MSFLHAIIAGLLRLLRRERIDRDLDEELRGYQEMAVGDRMRAGASRKEAARAVRLEMGTPEAVKSQVYEGTWEAVIETAWQDVRYALRLLRRAPAFTAAVVVTLTLGIGANTAIFTVVNAVLLHSLPYSDADRIAAVGLKTRGATPTDVTIAQFEYVRERSQALFDAIAAYRRGSDVDIDVDGQPDTLRSLLVTDTFFRVLDVRPLLGREIVRSDLTGAGETAIVLGDSAWQRLFQRDPNVIGRSITLDGATYTVVGVLPHDFTFVEQPSDLFLPIRLNAGGLDNLGTNTRIIARVRDGVGLHQAQSALDRLWPFLPDREGASGVLAVGYQSALSGDIRPSLLVLFGAVGLLLFAGCANVASLVLGRATSRAKEVSIRLAAGASRARLLRQGFTEGLVLSLIGGTAGLVGASWLLRGLVSSIPWELPCDPGAIRIDEGVLVFTFAAAVATAMIFGLAWLWQTSRCDPIDGLKEGGRRSAPEKGRRVRTSLVVVEVAMSVALLIGATLLAETLYNLRQERLGFDPANLTTVSTSHPRTMRVSPDRMLALNEELLRRLQALPGVTAAAATNVAPLTGMANLPAQAYGIDDARHSFGGTEIRTVTSGYFETMRTRVARGRVFEDSDGPTARPVAVINEALARLWWGDANPVGERIEVGKFRGRHLFRRPDPPREVIGVVADVKGASLAVAAPPTVYLPFRPMSAQLGNSTAWLVRSANPDIGMAIRRAVAEVDGTLRIRRLASMNSIVAQSVAKQQFDALVLCLFALVAVVLAGIGIYGVFNLQVNQQRHEMGIRVALGAVPRDLVRRLVGQGFVLAGIGAVIGAAAAFALTRFLRSLLFGVQPTSMGAYVVASAFVVVVGMLACYLPARRATQIDPLVALRDE